MKFQESKPAQLQELGKKLTQAVLKATSNALTAGIPVACFDFQRQKPYIEYPDGRKEYDIEKSL